MDRRTEANLFILESCGKDLTILKEKIRILKIVTYIITFIQVGLGILLLITLSVSVIKQVYIGIPNNETATTLSLVFINYVIFLLFGFILHFAGQRLENRIREFQTEESVCFKLVCEAEAYLGR